MKIANFNTDEKVFIIAEIGNNHEGDIEIAKRMIEAAANSGVDAVKFQTIRAENLIQSIDTTRFDTLKHFELSFNDYISLAEVASNEGVQFLSTPFDLEAASFLNNYVPAFKIASGDNNFYPLLEKVASFGKPIIMSTGLAELSQIEISKKKIEKVWAERKIESEIALLHCVSSYPTAPSEANLNMIKILKDKFSLCIGYSDHTLGTLAAASSVVYGSRIIEKHFTLNKNYSSFRDHTLSADPNEMKKLVKQVREIELMIGDGKKMISESELINSSASRRSIGVNKNIKVGAKIKEADLCWLRPGTGIQPGMEEKVIGSIAIKNISKGTIIRSEDLKK
jgi:sialic acid synthase SpsE